MTTHDPAQHYRRLSQDALRHFTNREKIIEMLESYLNAPTDEKMKVLVFYGVGGIGKTALQLKLCDKLRNDEPSMPFASFNIEKIGNKTGAYREVLLNLRSDFERDFGVKFPRFDLCWAVIVAHEGGNPEPLIRGNPSLQDTFDFAACLLEAPVSGLTGLVGKLIRRYPAFEKRIRHVFNTEDVINLRNMAMRDESTLPGKLISSFAFDLKEGLPLREGKACRGIIFLDSYETLWVAREGGASAQARLQDEWVRDLISYCLHPLVGVLPVICGRDHLQWDNTQLSDELDHNLLGRLSACDAQLFLSRCGVGPAPEESSASPLQETIIKCCQEQQNDFSAEENAYHPFYLALCAEIVLNTRENQGNDPPSSMFSHIPSNEVADELADRFLKSLNNRAMELWVSELSLTPRFDEEVALALDEERKHHNGRAGWERLKGFSFMDPQTDGSYRFHKIMGDVLRNKLEEKYETAVHEWFCLHWKNRSEKALSWHHHWLVEPEKVLKSWKEMHEDAIDHLKIGSARELLSLWDETSLDEYVHGRVGDEMWAMTHMSMGLALWKTPQLTRSHELMTAIEHYNEALKVYIETKFPIQWAKTQSNMGNAYSELPTGDCAENLGKAIQCYEAALRVYTETEFPIQWATTQFNLGTANSELPTGDCAENLGKAIQCYEAALRVHKEIEFPMQWGMIQNNLGNAYSDLPTGNRAENLEKAIQCYEAALRVRTETEFPMDWAGTQNNLGNAYSDLPTGNRAENLEKAIQCYKAALRVYTETEFPIQWATTQINLGNAYKNLLTGNRAEYLEKAIQCYEAALRVYTETEFPIQWATTQNNLGAAYKNLPTGDRVENLEKTIQCYEAALRVRTETEFPMDWAGTQNNLGNAYSDLPTGNRAENLEKAIQCYEAALRVRTETEFPMDWAGTQNNLGNAYSDLPTGNRAENLEKAIQCYEAALRVRTETEFPMDWAGTQNNLGNAYTNLPTGDRGENLEKAIQYYEAAARVLNEIDYPNKCVVVKENLKHAQNLLSD